MFRKARKPGRELGMLIALGAGAIAACSVDTSDIRFVPDSLIDDEAGGGAVGAGGVINNIAGVLGKGGADGEAGEGNGGASVGGSNTGGSKTGGSGGVGTGGAGTGGMPPMTCMHAVANPTQGEIDNLDDGDSGLPPNGGRHGGWYTYNDGTSTQMPMAGPNMPPPPEMGGAMGTPWAMHTRGGPFTVFGAGLGIVLNGAPDSPPCTYDVSPHSGLRFWVRGMNSDMILRVSLPTAETQAVPQGGTCVETNQQMPVCGDHFGYDFPVPTNWQQVEVSWDDLSQKGWGKMTQLRVEHAINIEFTVVRNVQFDFWIDQVAFY